MNKKLNIALTVVSVLFIGVSGTLLFKYIRNKRKGNFKDVNGKTTKDNFWQKLLYGVISVEYGFNTPCDNIWSKGCRGKRYTDVLHLDSGTIGIAHFAAGGLGRVYKNMDTEKYFGRSEREMVNNYADRNSGASDNDWWINGFKKFVNDRNNDKLQDKMFREARQASIDYAKEEGGWNTDREFAIAAGIGNSYGDSGFRKYARQYNWDADKLLEAYKYKFGQNDFSNHKNKRVIQINKWFPKSKATKINL